MMEQVLDVPSQEVITKDNAMVRVDGVVFFQILDAAKAAYEVSGLELAILNLTMTNLRTVMGSMDLDELLSQRDRINAQLLHTVDDATTPWGVKVTRIEIKDIAPPRDLVDSDGAADEGRARQARLDPRGRGHAPGGDPQAEGEKQANILEAEGRRRRRSAMPRRASARPRPRPRRPRCCRQALARGDRQAINYFVAQKYVEAFGRFAASPNQKIVFLPLEATALLGSLGGIGEIAREAFGRPNGAANGSDRP